MTCSVASASRSMVRVRMSPGFAPLGKEGLGEVDLGAVVRQEDGDLLPVALEAVDGESEFHGTHPSDEFSHPLVVTFAPRPPMLSWGGADCARFACREGVGPV